MTKRITQENTFSGYEFLAATPSFDNIEIYPPFANLASIYFRHKGLEITYLQSGSIKIGFAKMNLDERRSLSKEIKVFFKEARQKVISEFLIYKKNGISYL